jgi:hypothetical protein
MCNRIYERLFTMKIRWNSGSMRLRITPTEFATVLGGHTASEVLQAPGGISWQVRLEPGAETGFSSDGQVVVLSLSTADRERLGDPEAEGVYFQTDGGIRYFVEKDFPCVHTRAKESLEIPTETFIAPSDFERRKLESGKDGE